MNKKNVAEWISIILCLFPSPFVIMFLLSCVAVMREDGHISTFWAIVICAVIGLAALLFTSWVLGKLIYFIIK